MMNEIEIRQYLQKNNPKLVVKLAENLILNETISEIKNMIDIVEQETISIMETMK